MKTMEEAKNWLLDNCINENGDLDLSGMDFSGFDGNVLIAGIKVKNILVKETETTGESHSGRNAEGGSKFVTIGTCMGRKYCIDDRGAFPCAYVALLEDDIHDLREFRKCDSVNGGVAIAEMGSSCIPIRDFPRDEGLPAPEGYVGWYYGHYWDYKQEYQQEFPCSWFHRKEIDWLNEHKKRWSPREIEAQVVAMCKWLEERKANAKQRGNQEVAAR